MKYPLPDKPSIAVLPFLNLSKDPDQEYFSDGMADDLITDLSKISDLLVIARNSTFTYKGKSVKVKQVAEELGVRYVLEGSVRRAGDEIRINAQLIDAMTGHHVWAERYDGSMKDVFALQDRITQKIVLALAVRLTGTEKRTIAEKGTNNLEAHDEFLRGWKYYLPEKPDDLANAVKSFKRAVDLDPNYGRAHAALAYLYFQGTWVAGLYKGLEASGLTWLEARLRMGQYLKQGMMNPTPLAHHVNGLLYLFRRQHEEAVSELERALVLDPNDPSSNFDMAHVLNFSGKPREAVDFTKRAMRLDPHNPGPYSNILGIAHFCMGNLEEAATWLEKGFRLNPEVLGGNPWLASIYGLLGREKEARLALDNSKKAWRRELPLPNLMYALPFKDRAVADRFIEGILKAGLKGMPSEYFPAYNETRMTGEEIKRLLFGANTSGFLPDGQQWWVDYKKEGELSWRGPGPILFDTGKSWVTGNMIRTQYQKRFWGIEYSSTVFKNPKGTYEGKNEYVFCSDFGFVPFSLVK